MSAPRKIPSRDLVGRMAGVLQRFGFRQVHKSESGSRYLRLPPEPFTIRISNHRQPQIGYRSSHPQVVRSVALQSVTEPEVYLLALEQAVRYLAACETRRIQARRAPRRRA